MKLPKTLGLVLVLVTVLLLRLPSLFEPYWYGDEGIYLALGQMVQRGAVLYRDIWDNKPPLLYWIYAIQPTLLWAKITAMGFVLGTGLGVYFLSQKIFNRNRVFSLLATLLTGIFLSAPLLEGNIANAELYFTLPIVWGGCLVYTKIRETRYKIRDGIMLGTLAMIGFLFKIPAIFDFLGIFLAYSLIRIIEKRNFRIFIFEQIRFYLPIVTVFTFAFISLVLYFRTHQALGDFWAAVFSQNANYVEVGSGAFSKLTNPLFIKGLILLLTILALAVLFIRKRISKEFLFLFVWFGFSLYGALLSNRTYMHYLLQIVPPGILLTVYLVTNIRRYWIFSALYLLLLIGLANIFQGAFALNSKSYYQNWFDYVSETISWDDYVNYFDRRTLNSYQAAQYIAEDTTLNDPIYFWGEDAFIYVLANRPPVAKFIRAHHLTTVSPRNYGLVINRITKYWPKYILISRPISVSFPQLEDLINTNYRLANRFNNIEVYRRAAPITPPPWRPAYF